jgi:hypothetical protein
MAAEFWTSCRQPSDVTTNGGAFWLVPVLLGLLGGALAGFGIFLGGSIPLAWILGNAVLDGLILQATATAIAGAFAVGIIAVGALYGAVEALCDQLLRKQACLGGDRCAIGRVISANRKSPFFIDNDKTFNLLLAPHPDGVSDATLLNDGLQGTLVAQQASTNHLGFTGYPDRTPGGSQLLHCEIEGAGYHNHCIAFRVGAIAIGIAVGICYAFPPACPYALLAGLLIALLAYLLASLFTDDPDYEDAAVNPESGTIESADPETGLGGDCVAVTGRWIYDLAHDGWNELHPVLTLQKLPRDQCRADGDVAAFAELLKTWCGMIGQASQPVTITKQETPPEQWVVDPRLG